MENVRKHTSSRPIGQWSVSKTGGPCAIYKKPTKIQNSTFMLDQRYQVQEVLGSGAYGVVVSVQDTATGEQLAVKKIEKAFDHPTFTKRTLRELKIMRLLNHENILGIKSIQLPRSREEFDDIYLVMELLETDLSSIIKSPQPLSDDHCQFFLYQLLRGMKYMHSAGILHRDLKPRNLLVNSNCDLKICDFGLARAELPNMPIKVAAMTDYVATRWYRAPEVLLSVKRYSYAMDMWSIGCIFGELLTRRPLLPGKDSQDQIQLILGLVGFPTEEEIAKIPNPKARKKLIDTPRKSGRKFDTVFRDSNPLAVDLLRRMLLFDAQSRITVEDALEHPYLAQLHYPEDEPTTTPVPLYDFDFERQLLTARDLKDCIYEDILLHHFPEKVTEYEQAKAEYEQTMPGRFEESKGGDHDDNSSSDDEVL